MMTLFITNMQLLVSQDINRWTWLMSSTSGLLCFYQLFRLTAEDPLVNKQRNATFLQIHSDEETNPSTFRMAWGWGQFQQILIFRWTISLRVWVLLVIFLLWRWEIRANDIWERQLLLCFSMTHSFIGVNFFFIINDDYLYTSRDAASIFKNTVQTLAGSSFLWALILSMMSHPV